MDAWLLKTAAAAPAAPALVPPGFTFVPSAISAKLEEETLLAIDKETWDDTSLRRRVQHYGYRYAYDSPALTPAPPIPDWAWRLYEATGLACDPLPDQVIVNEYLPGQGIGAHTDHTLLFGDYVLAVSLGSGCAMDFQHVRTGERVTRTLPRRSAYKMEGEARHDWTHAIPARKIDRPLGPRGTRVSVTFRKVRKSG